jgi:hypothetical protein
MNRAPKKTDAEVEVIMEGLIVDIVDGLELMAAHDLLSAADTDILLTALFSAERSSRAIHWSHTIAC